MVKIGSPVPDFTANTTQGPITLSQYRGKWVLLFAHPADFTPVCTTEFVEFARRSHEFEELGIQIVGLSVDSIYSHIQWLRDMEAATGVKFNFPVIADPDKTVANMYDLVNEEVGLTVRGVFFIDPNGILRFAAYYPIPFGRNIDELLRSFKALQTVDRLGVACPVNWQPGDDVIIPPPQTLEGAKARDGKADRWYFWKRPVKEVAQEKGVQA
jgi:peroxiredoxin (alkyl hydroperoxide reductase subunit C)